MAKSTLIGMVKVGTGVLLSGFGGMFGLSAVWSTRPDAAGVAFVCGMAMIAGWWMGSSAFRGQGD